MHVLLADNQPKVRIALRTLLERKLGFQVVAEAINTTELWQQVEKACPDLLFLDWELAGPRVRDLLSRLHTVCPGLRVIALSSRPEVRQFALEARVDAFVSNGDLSVGPLRTMDKIAKGDTVCGL